MITNNSVCPMKWEMAAPELVRQSETLFGGSVPSLTCHIQYIKAGVTPIFNKANACLRKFNLWIST
jgi:hypothetical protein